MAKQTAAAKTAPHDETSTEHEEFDTSPNVDEGVEGIRKKLLHTLEIYPYISRGMIQQGLGPALPPKMWEPVLNQLLEQGTICKQEMSTEAPSGRALTKQIYHLPKFPYPPIAVEASKYQPLGMNPEAKGVKGIAQPA